MEDAQLIQPKSSLRDFVLWLFADLTFIFVSGLSYVLINFLIWFEAKDINMTVTFNLITFAGLLVNAILSGYLSVKISAKLTYLTAIFVHILLNIFLILNKENIGGSIYIVAICMSVVHGFVYNARYVIGSTIGVGDTFVRLQSLREAISSVFTLIVPLITGYILTQLDIKTGLIAVSFLFALSILALIPLKYDTGGLKFGLIELIRESIYDKGYRNVAILCFAIGISYVLSWGIVDVFIVDVLGSIESWVGVTVIRALLGILLSLWLGRVATGNQFRTKSILVLSTMLFSLGPVMFVFEPSVFTFVVFVLLTFVYQRVTGVLSTNFIHSIQKQDLDFRERRVTYQVVTDLYIAGGEFLFMLLTFVLIQFLSVANAIGLIMILSGVAPFAVAFVYQRRHR